jgi:hypothetical protein
MKRYCVALLALMGWITATSAEPIKPAIEVRVKALKELAPILEYGGELAGQPDAGKQFAALIQQFAANEKGFEGIDLNRPVGAYAAVTEKVEDSPVVVMIPVADEKAVLAALTEKLMLDPKKGNGGIYTMDVPNVPGSLHFRFADQYAYLTLRSEKGIDPAKLITPKDFFATKPDGFVTAVVHFDRWPTDVKKYMTTQLEHQLAENNSKLAATPVQKLFNDFLADVTVDAAKTILTDGDRLTLKLDVDPKTDDWNIAVGLTAKSGTTLAKTLAGFADRESQAAGIANLKSPLSNLGVNLSLPSGTKKKFADLMDQVAKQTLATTQESDRPGVQLVLDSVLPTLKSGDFQLGILMTPPASTGSNAGMKLAVKAAEGKKIETAAKVATLALPKDQGEFAGDVDEVGERKLHKLTLKKQPEIPFYFSTVWVLTSDDLISVDANPKADSLKTFATAKPVKTPMLFTEISMAQAVSLFSPELKPEAVRKVIKEVFGSEKPDGRDTLRVVARGGEKFELSMTVKGKAIALMAAIDRAKKGE